MKSIKTYFLIGAIMVLGFTLRVIGIHFGFPFLLHPDEPTISYNAFQIITTNSFEPNTYNRPDHIMIYINAIAYQISSYLWFHKSASFTYESNIQFFYVVGRLITAILGTITIYFAYLIGQEYNKRAGMITALLFAIFPLFVKNSHFITPDIPLVLFVMVVMFFQYNI
jgi:dolichyl-phosphate-mannose--protein O-mannosyl transferase